MQKHITSNCFLFSLEYIRRHPGCKLGYESQFFKTIFTIFTIKTWRYFKYIHEKKAIHWFFIGHFYVKHKNKHIHFCSLEKTSAKWKRQGGIYVEYK